MCIADTNGCPYLAWTKPRTQDGRMQPDASPILEVRNLTTTFDTDEGRANAVDAISFSLHKGETLGLVGESGCGKTVTAMSIMKLISKPVSIPDNFMYVSNCAL